MSKVDDVIEGCYCTGNNGTSEGCLNPMRLKNKEGDLYCNKCGMVWTVEWMVNE